MMRRMPDAPGLATLALTVTASAPAHQAKRPVDDSPGVVSRVLRRLPVPAGRSAAAALAMACSTGSLLVAGAPAGAATPYTAYVANSASGSVTTFNTATGSSGITIVVGKEPKAVAITPDGSTAYVVNKGSNTVTPIETATNSPGAAIAVGKGPVAIAITPDGKTAYVANAESNTVTPIETATNTSKAAIPVGKYPLAIAITPDGKTAYVANAEASSVTPIETATNSAGAAISLFLVGSAPSAIAIAPDGTTAYVATAASTTVVPIDTAANTIGIPIFLGEVLTGIAITPDGKTAYVATASNAVRPIAAATDMPGASIAVGEKPAGLAITPDQAPVATFTATAAPTGSASSFDASASSVAYGTIANYHWSFGDGESADTAAPATTHTYMAAGTYTVTLTETDSAGTSTAEAFTGQTVSRNGSTGAKVTHALSVYAAPQVTTEPSSVAVTPPGQASFTVACSGSPTPGVQWQVSTDGGLSFSEIPGQTAATLVISPTTLFLGANEYRALCTNIAGSKVSNAATLTLNTAPLVTSEPSSQSVIASGEASFTVACSGSPSPGVQWQLSSDRGHRWSSLPGQTSAKLRLSPTVPSENGAEYRAICTNLVGSVTSSAATLTVGRESGSRSLAVPPVLGSLVGVARVSGTILVKLPSSQVFVHVLSTQTVPIGSVIDASHGVLRLVTALDSHGKKQAATLWGGVFEVRQSKTGNGFTRLILKGALPTCARHAGAHASSIRKHPAKTRKLWAKDNHGRYRSVGAYSATTVLGTEWETEDTCAGTITRVFKGKVRVSDLHRHKSTLVSAGHSYLARP